MKTSILAVMVGLSLFVVACGDDEQGAQPRTGVDEGIDGGSFDTGGHDTGSAGSGGDETGSGGSAGTSGSAGEAGSSGSVGSGGSSGSSGSGSVTCGVIDTNGVASQVSVTSSSGTAPLGYVKTGMGTGSFSGSKTVGYTSPDYTGVNGTVTAAVVFDNITVGGKGALQFYITKTSSLATRHGHSSDDESYLTSAAAITDAVNDFASWRSLPLASRNDDFFLKGEATVLAGQVWTDPQLLSGHHEITIVYGPRCGTTDLGK